MTKEEFFEEYVEECFEDIGSDLEKVCEAIRKSQNLPEAVFYNNLYDCCSGAGYSIISGFNMFTDSIDMETMLDINSEILDWEIMNEIYQKATCDTKTLRETFDTKMIEADDTTDYIVDLHCTLSCGYNELSETKQRELNENLFDYMISVYEHLADEVWYAKSDEKDSYGNTKYHIIVSSYVEFCV